MARYVLLTDYDYCTRCHTCEVVCQQEHGYPVGINGVVVFGISFKLRRNVPAGAALKSCLRTRRTRSRMPR